MTKANHFGYTSEGFYTLLTRDGEPLYAHALPLAEKLLSHILYIALWLTCIFLFPSVGTYFMSAIFVHLFFFGCRLTTLLIKGGLLAVLFPPLHARITSKLARGAGIDLLKKHNLETHPGLLANLNLLDQNKIRD